MKVIGNNILFYHSTKCSFESADTLFQRDAERLLAASERVCYRISRKKCLGLSQSFVTIDDNHYETRVQGIQVKQKNSCKLDCVDHFTDVICDAIFRAFLEAWFCQHGKSQTHSIKKLLNCF